MCAFRGRELQKLPLLLAMMGASVLALRLHYRKHSEQAPDVVAARSLGFKGLLLRTCAIGEEAATITSRAGRRRR